MKRSSSKYVWSLGLLLGNSVCIISRSCWIQCALLWHLSSRDEIRGHKIYFLQFSICCTCCLTHNTEKKNTFITPKPGTVSMSSSSNALKVEPPAVDPF